MSVYHVPGKTLVYGTNVYNRGSDRNTYKRQLVKDADNKAKTAKSNDSGIGTSIEKKVKVSDNKTSDAQNADRGEVMDNKETTMKETDNKSVDSRHTKGSVVKFIENRRLKNTEVRPNAKRSGSGVVKPLRNKRVKDSENDTSVTKSDRSGVLTAVNNKRAKELENKANASKRTTSFLLPTKNTKRVDTQRQCKKGNASTDSGVETSVDNAPTMEIENKDAIVADSIIADDRHETETRTEDVEEAEFAVSKDTISVANEEIQTVTTELDNVTDIGTEDGLVLASGCDNLNSPATFADVRFGLQKAYLDGIQFMRLKVTEIDQELEHIKMEFYQCSETETEHYEAYLAMCNENFLQANNALRRKNCKLQVLDSEVQIVCVLNRLREVLEVDNNGVITFITEFWENIKNTMESLVVLVNKLKSSVVERLRDNCLSYNNADIHLDVSSRYMEEITEYLTDIEKTLSNTQQISRSFANGIHQDLFTHTKFTKRILIACDLKAFPLLRLFPDLTEKIESMFALCNKWLDRDERYMFEVRDYIKETRSMAKKRVEDLKKEKEKRKKIEKAVKSANILLHNNKEKLQKLETDLTQLESTFNAYKQRLESKHGEKTQKESMVDFLKITLSQTKKNYNLQMKRQRLLKQVKGLEQFLFDIQRDLTMVQDKIQEKAQQKDLLAGKVQTSADTYGVLKTDLDRFSVNLEQLEQEVNGLSGQLLQLEIIQTFKSSPENMDTIYDRPQSVKLAPSLKEKIKRKRKITAPVR